ncbi:MAG: glutathione peroxidase [Pseudogulbenkiania sp.]|nr:glutathione peroxidase [Pseudogulbenkiania sp.]
MPSPLYAFDFTLLDGSPAKLQDYAGKVILVVNTASQCGYTPQYAGLEALYQRYRDKGLVIIGFPCNQFGQQEPGNAEEIGAFCQKNFGVSFAIAGKVDVNGSTAHPLWSYLTRVKPGLLGTRRVKWNFTKFLIDRQGKVIARCSALTKPEALVKKIEALL